ncbi:zinc finger protein 585B-like [Macrobrachium nipponense]|uniref:zinc finger protein 585B-like n=1 Tax=Macrobrachium nipponense TaxID=159736 RepID=UPI0030C86FD3
MAFSQKDVICSSKENEEEYAYSHDLDMQVETDTEGQSCMNKTYDEQIIECSSEEQNCKVNCAAYEKMVTLTNKEKFICNECGKRFVFKGKLTEHMRIHTGEKPFICTVCGKAFKQKVHLEKHGITHTTGKPHDCQDCGKKFSRVETLKRHKRSHHGDKLFVCTDCGENFTQKGLFEVHVKIHTNDELIIDTECENGLIQKAGIKKYYNTNKTKGKLYPCLGDEKALIQSKHTIKCKRICSKDRPHICSTCGKRFIHKGHLSKHEKAHLDGMPSSHKRSKKKFGEQPVTDVALLRQEEIFFSEDTKIMKNQRNNFGMSVVVEGENFHPSIEHETEYEEKDPLKLNHENWTTPAESQVMHPLLDKIFLCKECGRIFSDKEHLTQHVDTHAFEKPFVCKECGEIFTQTQALELHMRTHTGDKLFICAECRKGFSQREHLEIHMKIHTNDQPFMCEICGEGYIEEADWKMHMKTHTGDKAYTCLECGKGFTRKDTFILHKSIHTGQRPFECDTCGKVFKHKGSLINHERTHPGNKVFIDGHFEEERIEVELTDINVFNNKNYVDKKLSVTKSSNCILPMEKNIWLPPKECDREFGENNTNKLPLEKCAKSAEPGTPICDKPFICNICGKVCGQRDQFDKHISSHNVRRPFECEECGKKFAHSGTLNLHKRTHTGRKLFVCSECGKTFTQKGHFRVHMRIHTGDRPFPCEVCGRAYSQKNDLDVHMRIHTGERPYTCTVCGKSFGRKDILGKHKRTHTGDKPFTCHYCGKSFRQKGHLDKHTRTHLRGNMVMSDLYRVRQTNITDKSLEKNSRDTLVRGETKTVKSPESSLEVIEKVEEEVIFGGEFS